MSALDFSGPARNRTLVTGFGAFGSVTENPSALLAQDSGRPFRILEVAYSAVDQFLAELDPGSFDRLILLGVAARSQKLRWETVARNQVGTTPDVRGIVANSGRILPEGPAEVPTSFSMAPPESPNWEPSDNAGDYLCNYSFYQALLKFPENEVLFIHVPPFESLPRLVQQAELEAILNRLEQRADQA